MKLHRRQALGWMIGGCAGSLGLGCRPETAVPSPSAVGHRTDIALRIGLPSDVAMAEPLTQAWGRVSEQALEIRPCTSEDLAQAADQADVLIIRESWAGMAGEANLVSPLPKAFIAELQDSMHLLRRLHDESMRWEQTTIGVSLGSPLPVMVLGDGSPQDIRGWEAWRDAVLEAQRSEGKPQAAEPLNDGWRAAMFLLRAAAMNPEVWLFDNEGMRAAIDGPKYIAALELMRATRAGYPEKLLSPAEIWEGLQEGSLRMGVTVPQAPGAKPLRFAGLTQEKWPLMGRGLIACVARGCRQTAAARGLVRWLAGPDGIPRGVGQDGYALNATGDDAAPGGWPELDPILREKLDSSLGTVPTLRLSGATRYLAEIDAAVLKALDGTATPEQALQDAARQWDAITQELGEKNQRRAWLRSQGLTIR